jgi:aspartate carbamoyltransferase catalytic subunit
MMLRLQKERMDGAFIPSEREYYHRFGLDAEKLKAAKPDAIVMHPGPMNRGVEIDGTLADDINRSVIQEQVEMGVAVRMAAMDLLARNLRAAREAGADAGGDGMTPTALHVFAVNGDSDLRHTNLTRAHGRSARPAALEDWLGVDAL